VKDNRTGKLYCDECGKNVTEFKRRIGEHRFCDACYVRIFEKRTCQNCNSQFREHPTSNASYCRRCRPKFSPCVRCGRLDYKVNKLTPYGAVCHSCYQYFVTHTPCTECGNSLKRTSRYLSLKAFEPLCDLCAEKRFDTCSNCGRRRHPLTQILEEKLCRKCFTSKTTICRICSTPYPSGHGSQCRNCTFTLSVERKLPIDIALFEHPYTQEYYKKFAYWLIKETSASNAATKLHSYISMFKAIDSNPTAWNVDVKTLSLIDKAQLRKDSLVLRYFNYRCISIPTELLRDVSMQRVISKCVNHFQNPNIPNSVIFKGYASEVLQKCEQGEIKISSTKQSLSTANSLLQYLIKTKSFISNASIRKFLAQHPGQRASITGFVNYCHEHYDLEELELPQKPKLNAKAVVKLYLKNHLFTKAPSIQEIRAFMVFCHNAPVDMVEQLTMKHVLVASSSFLSVQIDGKLYQVDLSQLKNVSLM